MFKFVDDGEDNAEDGGVEDVGEEDEQNELIDDGNFNVNGVFVGIGQYTGLVFLLVFCDELLLST